MEALKVHSTSHPVLNLYDNNKFLSFLNRLLTFIENTKRTACALTLAACWSSCFLFPCLDKGDLPFPCDRVGVDPA